MTLHSTLNRLSETQYSDSTASEQLLPTLLTLTQKMNIPLNSIQLLGVTCGPGSFTGVRIAIAFAQTMQAITRCGVVAISSLQALCLQAKDDDLPYQLCCIDARMGGIYWALFGPATTGNQTRERMCDDVLEQVNTCSYLETIQQLTIPIQQIALRGSGASLLQAHAKKKHLFKLACEHTIDSRLLLDYMLNRWAQGELSKNIQPLYLRDANHWQKKKKVDYSPQE